MKTLADFKRKMKIGSIWDSEYVPTKRYSPNRECKVVQTNSFALTSMNTGSTENSWCDWPKASMCEFSSDGRTISIYEMRSRPRAEDEQDTPAPVRTLILKYTYQTERT